MASPVSIVIPAYNEEKVIGRCLRSLLAGAEPDELEVVVAVNGTTDRTAEIARSFGPMVRVVETKTASKIAALNLGDEHARYFPRFYVDADIVLDIRAIREVAQVLRDGPALAAAPRLEMDLTDRPWAVRAYYDVWTRMPYYDDGMIGSGVYALSEAGRARWGKFPDVIGDDYYVWLHFAPGERVTVKTCSFRVRPPNSVEGMIKIFTRVRAGNAEINTKYPELAQRGVPQYRESALRVLSDPSLWPKVPVYAAIVSFSKLKGAERARKKGAEVAWTPEQSSREG